MANIKTHLNNIKNALFGNEVRGSIHDGIDAINKEVESTTGRQEHLETTFDQLTINAGNSNAEIVDARVKADGTSYKKLGDRLDSVDSQLEQNMNEVSVLRNVKRDKSVKIKSSELETSTDADKIKLINLSDEVQKAITGNAQVNPVIPEKSVTVDKLTNGEEYEKQMGFYSDTIEMIDISTSDKSINITLSRKDNDQMTLYRMSVNGIRTQAITIQSQTSYSIENWGTLIWDYQTTTIRTVAWNSEIPKDAMILLVNAEGKPKDGYLLKRYNEIHDDYIRIKNTLNVNLEKPETLYVYNAYTQFPTISESNGVYFKFEGLINLTGSSEITFSRYFDFIYNEVGVVNQDQSIEWVQNCIRVRENHILVYDLYNDKFKIIPFTDFNKSYYVNILSNVNGRISEGYLNSIWYHENLRKVKVKENGIPTYYHNHIKYKENIVIGKENANSFNIAFTTDNHIHEHMNMFTLHSHNILNKLDNSLNLLAVLNGGDSVPFGQDNKEQSFEALKTGINKFKNKYKYFNAQGNHDTNAKSGVTKHKISNLITQNEIYKVLGKHLDNDVVWGDKGYMYYYKDFDKQKVRLIVLNNSDVPVEDGGDGTTTIDILETLGMRQDQIEWLANKALKFDDKSDNEEWEVILLSHYFTHIDGVHGGADWHNRTHVHEILKSFVNGTSTTQTNNDEIFGLNVTADFTEQGAKKIIGYFCGHCHYDFMRVVDGIPFISSQADYKSNWHDECPHMEQGTITEIAFDIITIDKVSKNVKLTRFGAGEDREYNY